MSTTARSPGQFAAAARSSVDPRGPRFAGALTTLVLAVALAAAPSRLTVVLLAVQVLLFGTGAVAGVQRTPYSWLFRALIRPRLGRPRRLEDAAAPQFAQAVGFAFAAVALIGFLAGLELLGLVATGLALAAAFLNAAFGFCLGCEVYLLVRRIAPRRTVTP